MSELSVTKITDRVGTGKVNFSQGFKVAGTLDTTLAPTRTEGNTEPATPANGDTWYDTDNETYDVYINDEWKRFLGSGGGAASWTVDLSNVTYDSVSFSTSSQDINNNAFGFNLDGTKMYAVGNASDSAYQYTLSTAFNVSTASYDSVSFSLSGLQNLPYGGTFNADGTKMYTIGFSSDSVLQHSLSTAFDLSTASYDSVSFSVASQDTVPYTVVFNTDGTKMYIIGNTSDSVHQYSLSTGFDLSTASYDSVSFSISSQDTTPIGMFFNTDGTKMYVAGGANDSVYQYSLSTGFDLSTASYDNVSLSVSSQTTSPNGLFFSADGAKMYVRKYGTVYQYSTGL